MAKAKFNKKVLLKKLIDIPKSSIRIFYAREMKLLNDLIDCYNIEFIATLSLSKKYDSVAILLCDSFKETLDSKFRCFNYKINESLYETNQIYSKKFDQDLILDKKPKTIKIK